MARGLAALCICVVLAASARPAARAQDAAHVASDAAVIEKTIIGDDLGRYMEHACAPGTYPGWEGFPLVRCTYTGNGGVKLVVVMLNAAPAKLARWVASGCRAAALDRNPKCWRKLWRQIKLQSGAQFPIAGLVDETGNTRVCTSICFITFRDGIAVPLKAIEKFPPAARAGQRSINRFDVNNADQVAWALSADFHYKIDDQDAVGSFARIAGATVGDVTEWVKKNPADAAPDGVAKRYPDLIAYYYKKAWNADRNVLVDAWAHANSRKLR